MPSRKHTIALELGPIREAVETLRRRSSLSREHPDGCSIYPIAPGSMVKYFAPLRLKKGWTIRGFIFGHFMGHTMLPFGLPRNVKLPSPDRRLLTPDAAWKGLSRLGALKDYMAIVEGDGSAASYLLASILSREIAQIGAFWHGLHWRTHVLLESDPWKAGPFVPYSDWPMSPRREWSLVAARPRTWKPSVTFVPGRQPVVSFYSLSARDGEAIYVHQDTFGGDGMSFTSTENVIATGGGGYML